MTKDERDYMDLVASLSCVVCRNLGYGETPADLHHPRFAAGAGQRSPHSLVIPLCNAHHQSGGLGVALHAGQQAFERLYGSEIALLAQTNLDVFRKLR